MRHSRHSRDSRDTVASVICVTCAVCTRTSRPASTQRRCCLAVRPGILSITPSIYDFISLSTVCLSFCLSICLLINVSVKTAGLGATHPHQLHGLCLHIFRPNNLLCQPGADHACWPRRWPQTLAGT